MDLSAILNGFKAPLNEEQAWAVCHQHAKRFIAKRTQENYAVGYPEAADLGSVYITEQGEVLIVSDKVTNSEKELVVSFGRVLFDAFEFGTDPNDQKILSPDLERLIERMTLSYDGMLSEEDDEGYEEDHHASLNHGPCTWEVVVKMCEEHLDRPVKANEHYLAVCRALITEAVDLKSFLEKVSAAGESLKTFANINNNNDISGECQGEEFPKLNFTEWAHLWIQVVSDLRVGVKLKKVEGYTRNVEYELTPYEILMEDIRQKNYTLKKISVNGEIPRRVKQNAHDIILDFIKSRPTLKPIGDRKLRSPPPRSKSLHERLLEQIQEPPSPLRHVGSARILPPFVEIDRESREEFFQASTISTSKSCDFSRIKMSTPAQSYSKLASRRRIKAPPLSDFGNSTLSTPSDPETETDDDDSSFAIDSIATDDLTSTTVNDTMSPFKRHSAASNPNSLRSSGTSGVSSGGAEEPDALPSEKPGVFMRNLSTVRRKKLLSVELPALDATPNSSFDCASPSKTSYTKYSARNGIRRAQSMAVRPTSNVGTTSSNATEDKRLSWRERRALNLQKSSAVDLPLPPPMKSTSPVAKRDRRDWTYLHGRSVGVQRTMSDRRAFGPTRLQDRWKYPLECLELTVEELIHIRQVLARADLEKYQGQGRPYTNLKTGKVCFNCRVREFTIFWWARTCQICKQKICSKCMQKVRAPADEYLKTPVHTLSPSLDHNWAIDNSATGVENYGMPLARTPFDSNLSVLRERNAHDRQPQTSKFQLPSTSWRSKGGRKMDVCEECCELISRIIYTNNMAADGALSKTDWNEKQSSDLARFVFARPTSVADRMLRRSTSSAGFMASYAPRGNIGTSRSIQSFQAAAK